MQQYEYDFSKYTLVLQRSQVVFHTIEAFQSFPKTN